MASVQLQPRISASGDLLCPYHGPERRYLMDIAVGVLRCSCCARIFRQKPMGLSFDVDLHDAMKET